MLASGSTAQRAALCSLVVPYHHQFVFAFALLPVSGLNPWAPFLVEDLTESLQPVPSGFPVVRNLESVKCWTVADDFDNRLFCSGALSPLLGCFAQSFAAFSFGSDQVPGAHPLSVGALLREVPHPASFLALST